MEGDNVNWNSNNSREKPLARRGRGDGLTNRQAVTIALVMLAITTAVFLAAITGYTTGIDWQSDALKQAWAQAERVTRSLVLGGVLVLGCGWMIGNWIMMMSEEVEQ
jgi:hypothetical protein